jgi:hypothetical protein
VRPGGLPESLPDWVAQERSGGIPESLPDRVRQVRPGALPESLPHRRGKQILVKRLEHRAGAAHGLTLAVRDLKEFERFYLW